MLFIPAAALSLAFVFTSLTASPRENALFAPDETTIDACNPSSLPCLRQAIGNVTWREGASAAIALVRAEIGTGSPIEQSCHALTHQIGSVAFFRAGDRVADAFIAGDNICNSGYYHGVIQAAFDGLERPDDFERLSDRAFELCRETLGDGDDLGTELASHCAHGVGHGAMLAARGSLSRVLLVCDSLLSFPESQIRPRPLPRQDLAGYAATCANGAFMEAFSPTNEMIYDEWSREGDLAFPCTVMPDRYARECYNTLVARLAQPDGSLERVADSCLAISGPRAGDCMIGYATALGNALLDAPDPGQQLLEGCRAALPWVSQCVHSTIDALGNHYERAIDIAPYCAALPAGWPLSLCGRTIGWKIGLARAGECRLLDEPLVAACQSGARGEFIAGGLDPNPIYGDYPVDPVDAPWLADLRAP